MIVVGFKILSRTPVPKLPPSYPPRERTYLSAQSRHVFYCLQTQRKAVDECLSNMLASNPLDNWACMSKACYISNMINTEICNAL